MALNKKQLHSLIGKKVKYYRTYYKNNINKKYTQEGFSEIAELSSKFLSCIEADNVDTGLSIYNLYKISYYLKVPINYLMNDDYSYMIDPNKDYDNKLLNDNALYNLVGRNIRYYRLNYNLNVDKLTQDDLAKKTKITRSTISMLESKQQNAATSIYNLYKISNFLKVPIEEFFKLPPNERNK